MKANNILPAIISILKAKNVLLVKRYVDAHSLSFYTLLILLLTIFPSVLSLWLIEEKTPFSRWLIENATIITFILLSNLFSMGMVIIYFLKNEKFTTTFFKAFLLAQMLSILVVWYFDFYHLYKISSPTGFSQRVTLYLAQKGSYYFTLMGFIGFLLTMRFTIFHKLKIDIAKKSIELLSIFCMVNGFVIIFLIVILNVVLFYLQKNLIFYPISSDILLFFNIIFASIVLGVQFTCFYSQKKEEGSLEWLLRVIKIAGMLTLFLLLMEYLFNIIPSFYSLKALSLDFKKGFLLIKDNAVLSLTASLPLLFVGAILLCYKKVIKIKLFSTENMQDKVSGNFGKVTFAKKKDLEQLGCYKKDNGLLIGLDEQNKPLYLPLTNKLTISPPGGWKTSASSIPMLLSYEGPVFAFDIKGELWAVTARYRHEVMNRKIVTIDPFDLIQTRDFSKNKPATLLKKYQFNPFDAIAQDIKERDRMINAFAASFIINEEGYATHFDENAKILIRGYIDYLMSLPYENRNLPFLFELMSQNVDVANITFNEMSKLSGRAAAAANQITRVGMDERGSILSTSYRQIDWMGDSNIQALLEKSNFDLKDFLKGNMDIFVILPEDQVKEHSRLVRMLMSLLMGMIVKAHPKTLPKKKMIFLLEELAQLGYCPDVEQCIEVLRARGVIVWTVFQTLSQIEVFKKADLFKGTKLKQIFTTDDTKTMEWIQTLGGKKTVLTKTYSNNTGSSKQKTDWMYSSTSQGEGESVQETGVDLIHLNEIRELPANKQFVFLQGEKPILCKKARYFEHPIFKNKFDKNPLEE